MRLLIPYLARYQRDIVLALCLSALGQLCTVVEPLLVRYAIDTYATHARAYSTAQFIQGVGVLMGVAAAVAVAARIAERSRGYFVTALVQRVGADLYADGMERSVNLAYPLLEEQESGRTMGILQTTRADVQRFISVAVNVVFTSAVGLLFLGILAYRAHWLLAPAVLLVLPAVGMVSASLGRHIRTLQHMIVGQVSALLGASTELLRNVETVRSLGVAAPEVTRLREMNARVVHLELQKARYVRVYGVLNGTGVTLLRTGLLFAMLYLLYTMRITLGELFALALYAGFVFMPLRELGSSASVFREAQASLARLAVLLGAPQDATAQDASSGDAVRPRALPAAEHRMARPSTIVFDNVTFQHPTATHPALGGVSFALGHGETTAFVGPSGAGKSTIMRLLLGLYRPQSGEIRYNGAPASAIGLEVLRRSAGVITQETQLFAGTIRDNLCVAKRDASDTECIEALREAGAEHLLRRGEEGLATVIGEGGVKLSGGERQRIAIARALLRQPVLLLVDEATASLDSLAEQEISGTIRDISRRCGGISVVIAHRLATVMHADRIHVLDRGRVVETGTHAPLVARDGLYAAMWWQQVGGSTGTWDGRGASGTSGIRSFAAPLPDPHSAVGGLDAY